MKSNTAQPTLTGGKDPRYSKNQVAEALRSALGRSKSGLAAVLIETVPGHVVHKGFELCRYSSSGGHCDFMAYTTGDFVDGRLEVFILSNMVHTKRRGSPALLRWLLRPEEIRYLSAIPARTYAPRDGASYGYFSKRRAAA